MSLYWWIINIRFNSSLALNTRQTHFLEHQLYDLYIALHWRTMMGTYQITMAGKHDDIVNVYSLHGVFKFNVWSIYYFVIAMLCMISFYTSLSKCKSRVPWLLKTHCPSFLCIAKNMLTCMDWQSRHYFFSKDIWSQHRTAIHGNKGPFQYKDFFGYGGRGGQYHDNKLCKAKYSYSREHTYRYIIYVLLRILNIYVIPH